MGLMGVKNNWKSVREVSSQSRIEFFGYGYGFALSGIALGYRPVSGTNMM